MTVFKLLKLCIINNTGLDGFPLGRLFGFFTIFPIFLCTHLLSFGQDSIVLTLDKAMDLALDNSYLLKNAALRLEQNSLEPIAAWNVYPTEVNYRFGQLYSVENDAYLEINQNFGSLLTYIRRIQQADIRKRSLSDEYNIAVSEISAQVKSAYFFWLYTHAITSLLENKKNMFSRLDEIAGLKYKSGDISLLEKTLFNSKVAEVNAQYLNSIDDTRIAENKLHQLLSDTGNYIPPTYELELYKIKKESDTSGYNGNLYIDYYENRYALAVSEESLVRSSYFPELKAGIFTQDITGLHQLYGGQIGLAFPLWFPGNRVDLKKARINSEIAMNEVEYQRNNIEYEVENLLLELNKYFRQIRYFQAVALPKAELLVNSAMNQLDAEEIEYSEFLESIQMATEIRKNYYEAILNYNQKAIQLEIYAY
jgi:cobalt-zinc-cadmium resistance protein CzcA